MDHSFFSRFLVKTSVAILLIVFADLLYLNWWVFKVENGKLRMENFQEQASAQHVASPSPSVIPSSEASTSPAVKMIEKAEQRPAQTVIQTAQKEIFIPIGSMTSSKSNYEDTSALEISIDTTKYSAIESVVFEASLWVQDGNGKSWAQLYNKTDGRPVWNSEISATSATGVLKTSSKITLEPGLRTYIVQTKTDLTSYAAHVDNARIKITLK